MKKILRNLEGGREKIVVDMASLATESTVITVRVASVGPRSETAGNYSSSGVMIQDVA